MEDEVRKREFDLRKREQVELKAKQEREEKDKKDREATFATIHKAEKRTKSIQDILAIEKTYVSVLSLVIRKFLSPLQASSKTMRPIISQEKIRNIFSITEVIYNYHQLLLDRLESRVKRWLADKMANPLQVGDIFIKWTDYMTCYSTYINNYNLAISTINECKKTVPAFAHFLKRLQADPECRNQELEYYIINPVQQLPRYILLLSDCLRNTQPEHPDFESLTQAVDKIRKVTSYVNEQKREAEDASAIVSIQQNIRGKFPTLLVPYRKFHKEGYLNFTENGVFRTKEGYSFLFNDLLVFTVKLASSKTEYTWRGQVSIGAASKLENLKDDAKTKNAFMLKGEDPNNNAPTSVTLSARSPAEKTAWMDTLKGVVSNYKPRQTFS